MGLETRLMYRPTARNFCSQNFATSYLLLGSFLIYPFLRSSSACVLCLIHTCRYMYHGMYSLKAQFLYSVATFCQALGQFVAIIQGRQSVDGLMSGLGAKCWHKLRLKVPLNCFLSLHPGMSGSIVYSHNLETCQGMKCV